MSPHVLLIGGHGKVAQLLTPLLLRRAWTVTSLIRNPDQVAAVQGLAAADRPAGAELRVMVRSLEDAVGSPAQAKALLDEVRPDYVVWSAGAGGKGGPERTLAVDRDSAQHVIGAAATSPSVKRFVMISYLGSRRLPPAWWDAAAWENVRHVNETVLPTYYQAKLAADEALYRAARQHPESLAALDLRPGGLTDEPVGPVELGRTATSAGQISRASVAAVVDEWLAQPTVHSAWLDLLNGSEPIDAAVARVVRDKVDAVEGEPVTKIQG